MSDYERLAVKPQCSGDRFGRAGCVAIGQHHDQAAKCRVTIRTKYAVLTSRWFAQSKDRFRFGTKPLRKLCGQPEIVCCLAGAKIDDERVHLFPGESAETLVQRLKIGIVQRPDPRIPDAPSENLAVKGVWRCARDILFARQKYHASRHPDQQALNSCPIQLRVGDRVRIREITFQQCDNRL